LLFQNVIRIFAAVRLFALLILTILTFAQ